MASLTLIGILFFLACGCLNKVDATGKLQIKFITFDNPEGKGGNGNCCDGKWIFCETRGCDHAFTICVDNFYGTPSMNSCPIGKRTTDAVQNQDYITFGSMIGSTRNLMTFNFERWRLGARIKVKIVDDDDGVNSHDYVDTVLTRFATTPALQESSATWRRFTLTARTTLAIDVKVFCDPHFFGKDCATSCNADDGSGHFDCQRHTGQKICHPGWTDDDCDTQINECASDPCQNGGTCEDQQNSFTCRCADGYQGQLCQADVNECAVSPCQNGGTCSNTRGSFSCQCRLGFTGTLCDVNIDECESSPCLHGECLDLIDEFKCRCTPGYTGELCEDEINECDKSPCQNNGTCQDLVNKYSCSCPPGMTGLDCETNINECLSNPCHGGGDLHSMCIDLVDGYQCACPQGWTGVHCDVDLDECISEPCFNGGTCVDRSGGFNCSCAPGWVGELCQENLDECASNPCYDNQTCTDGIDSYACKCPHGWAGEACEADIDECLHDPCFNNGSCSNFPGSFSCSCPLEFEGDLCDKEVNPCDSNPCQNEGLCVKEDYLLYNCTCQPRWTGENCEIYIDDCSVNQCNNNGTCEDVENYKYQCHCTSEWFGEQCDFLRQCNAEVCKNGGRCEDQIEGPVCHCGVDYGGVRCGVDLFNCSAIPCHNGGECLRGVYCECPADFTGRRCESLLADPCDPNPCANGATCVTDPAGNFSCACPESYSGVTCSLHEAPPSDALPNTNGNYDNPHLSLLDIFMRGIDASIQQMKESNASLSLFENPANSSLNNSSATAAESMTTADDFSSGDGDSMLTTLASLAVKIASSSVPDSESTSADPLSQGTEESATFDDTPTSGYSDQSTASLEEQDPATTDQTRDEGAVTEVTTSLDEEDAWATAAYSGSGDMGGEEIGEEDPYTLIVTVTEAPHLREKPRPSSTPAPSASENEIDHHPYKPVRETAYLLSGALKEGHLEVISDNLKVTIADYLKSKPRNVDIAYDVTECTSENGNLITVLLVTATEDGEIIMSDTITEMFGRMKTEQFQSLFPLPVDHEENCLPEGLPSTSEGTNGVAMYTVIGMIALLFVAAVVIIILVAIRRKRSRKLIFTTSKVRRQSDDPLRRMNPLYRHYRESGIILPPSPAGQTITINPTFTPDDQQLAEFKPFHAVLDNQYDEPLMVDDEYAEVQDPVRNVSFKPNEERPKLTLDLSKCNLEFIDRTSSTNLYDTPRCDYQRVESHSDSDEAH